MNTNTNNKKKNNNVNTLAIIGSQWGDEGKGKVTDYFSQCADYVVRWAGGDNAGHTVVISGKKYKLSIIPSGVFNKNTVNIIANGCVVNLRKLISEIDFLEKNGYYCNNLRISNRAHLIFPYHIKIDELQEKFRKSEMIGTTQKGIGPCYQDKAERIGIRLGDMFDSENFKKKLEINLSFKNRLFKKIFNSQLFSVEKIYNEYMIFFEKIRHLVVDTSILLNEAINNNKKILFEGAQGAMLDIDHGTYPFVTSSNTTAASIPVGCGISPRYINNIIGITKAYNTRVGEGAFPSEILSDPIVEYIRKTGHEYGTVSGRARRIGWFDSVLIQHFIRISGCTSIAIMLLDVLTNIEKIKICIGYEFRGRKINYIPSTDIEFNECKPILIEMQGWKEDISNVTSYNELPLNAKKYLDKLKEIISVPISLFSVGPDRVQTVLLDKNIF